jgi:hypothetical protein
MQIHYAMQVCDVSNNQTNERYCKTDRTTLSKKSIMSLIKSIEYVCTQVPQVQHHLLLLDDNSTNELKQFLVEVTKHNKSNLTIEVQHTTQRGLMSSVRTCYQWLVDNGTDLVYQIQDDYLFNETAIWEMVDIFLQIRAECKTDCIVTPFNDSWLWLTIYRNCPTPRAVFVGKKRYWISLYDVSCSFMSSVDVFKTHWDLLDNFCNLPATGVNGALESLSLNKLFVERGVLGVVPINSLALHIQSDLEKDPYIDWQAWWDNV